jgi:thiosulfate reductase cytochrome b subunit
MFIMFTFFIFLHAYMGMLGPKWSSHYKEMITGWEEPHD